MLMEKHGGRTLPMLLSLTVDCFQSKASRRHKPVLRPGILTRVLQGARNLTTLNVFCTLDTEHEPGIFDAIASLPRLSRVAILEADEPWLAMLSRTHVRHVSFLQNPEVISTIRPLQSSLEALVLRPPLPFFARSPHAKDCVLPLASTDEWPFVHTLDIWRLTVPLSELARAFPNVRSLVIKRTSTHGAPTPQTYSSWRRLEYLGVTTTGLRDLALSCPVRELYVSSTVDFYSNEDACPVFDVLDHIKAASPAALSVVGLQVPKGFLRRLAGTLPNLRVFGLSFHERLDAIAERMVRVPVTTLYFILRADCWKIDGYPALAPTPPAGVHNAGIRTALFSERQ
jgi:hypothetical protein